MSNIFINVNDSSFLEMFSARTEGIKQTFAFIDWVPSSLSTERFVSQIQAIKECQDKQTPTVIFDRYSSMTVDETVFLLKQTNTILLEPVINPRPGFRFMPYWIHFKEHRFSDFQEDRKFQTGYKGNIFTNDLEAVMLSAVKDGFSVGLDIKLSKEKYDILKTVISINKFDYSQFVTMILTGTQDDYDRGSIPDISHLMYNGTVPMLYHKHKWLHSIFRHFIIYDNKDIRWAIKLYKNCGCGFIEQMQKNILEYIPEMEANNFITSILEKISKL